jgi:hypothetical protein
LIRISLPFSPSDGNISSFRGVLITSSPYKHLEEGAKKKKKKKKKGAVNEKGSQSRSQEKNVRNVTGTERKLVCGQKNKSCVEDRTTAEINMKKLVKCKASKSQTRKRQVLGRISSSLDS